MLQSTSETQSHPRFLSPTDDDDVKNYWNEKCQTYRSHLASYANRLTNHMSHDAEDLVHDTYCRAFAQLRCPDGLKYPRASRLRLRR